MTIRSGARDWHHIFNTIQLDSFNGSVIFPLYGCKTEIFEGFNGNFRLLRKSRKIKFICDSSTSSRQNIFAQRLLPAYRC